MYYPPGRRFLASNPGFVCSSCAFRLGRNSKLTIRRSYANLQSASESTKDEQFPDLPLHGLPAARAIFPKHDGRKSGRSKGSGSVVKRKMALQEPDVKVDNVAQTSNQACHTLQRSSAMQQELGKSIGPGVSKPNRRKERTWRRSPTDQNLFLKPIKIEQPQIPSLSYGLDRVLFNPGVYRLQDSRSRVYNFDPYLEDIMPASEFDFDALRKYITSSEDENLLDIARNLKKRYTGSTSSMTTILSHFHYLLSAWREPNMGMLSANFPSATKSFTNLLRAPSASFLRFKDGVYAVDADKEFSTTSILSMLGKSMEKLLTLDTKVYERYRKTSENSSRISTEEAEEAYNYTTFCDFVMRSQLDAHDSRLPGTGVFDLKTRAVVSIRMDVDNYESLRDYEILTNLGEWESFEREYHDMIRAAFLKYSLQVRMGRMDGIFVAYHNTQKIFGFQYIPLEEMDYAIHGQYNTQLGNSEFKLSMYLFNTLLNMATEKYPGKSLRIYTETRPSSVSPFMYFFAEPVPEEDIEKVQNQHYEQEREAEANLTTTSSSLKTEGEEILQHPELRQLGRSLQEFWQNPKEYWTTVQSSLSSDEPWRSNAEFETESLTYTTDQDLEILTGITLEEDIEQHSNLGTSSEYSTASISAQDDFIVDLAEHTNLYEFRPTETLESAADASLQRESDRIGVDQGMNEAEENDDETKDGGPDDTTSEGGANTPTSGEHSSKGCTGELFGRVLRIRNKVGGEIVRRPINFTGRSESWQLEYSVEHFANQFKMWQRYEECKKRRRQAVTRSQAFAGTYIQKLAQMSKNGRERRNKREARERGSSKVVVTTPAPKK